MEEIIDEIIEELRSINPWVDDEHKVDAAIQRVIEKLQDIY